MELALLRIQLTMELAIMNLKRARSDLLFGYWLEESGEGQNMNQRSSSPSSFAATIGRKAMALQTGVSSSKVLILVGAGLTGSIVFNSGRLAELVSQLQEILKGVDEANVSSNKFDSALLAAQIRQLAQDIKELSLSNPITIYNGNSTSSGSYASYLVPAAALGAMGYCYMWWKGWSFTDAMFVTKRNMANAVETVSKQLENVSQTLATTRRHLSNRLESLDWKLDEQKEISKLIADDVFDVKFNLSQIGLNVEVIHQMVSGLEDKIELIESKQDVTNSGLWHLCQLADGFQDAQNGRKIKDVSGTLANNLRLPYEETSAKGLQFISETNGLSDIENSVTSVKMNDSNSLVTEKGAILLFLVSVASPDFFVGDRHPNDRCPSSSLYYFYSSLQRVGLGSYPCMLTTSRRRYSPKSSIKLAARNLLSPEAF
ncbi:hypothetical protein NL676_017676 [Syzygium grande]|nr:hypothetical protein NL676_017676 [Syzygium grande]